MKSGAGAEYYRKGLSGERLMRCYEVASPRVYRYLAAELDFVRSHLRPSDRMLELGCGYGRAALELARRAAQVVGVDTSAESLELARKLAAADAETGDRCEFIEMDAASLVFPDGEFDVVACIQNGICAFRVDPARLVGEALRVTRPGGKALFSTYAARFWPDRLQWFEAQAAEGLIGELDRESTGGGTIVCKDGLHLGALSPGELRDVGLSVGLEPEVVEIDGSSVFAVWHVPPDGA